MSVCLFECIYTPHMYLEPTESWREADPLENGVTDSWEPLWELNPGPLQKEQAFFNYWAISPDPSISNLSINCQGPLWKRKMFLSPSNCQGLRGCILETRDKSLSYSFLKQPFEFILWQSQTMCFYYISSLPDPFQPHPPPPKLISSLKRNHHVQFVLSTYSWVWGHQLEHGQPAMGP